MKKHLTTFLECLVLSLQLFLIFKLYTNLDKKIVSENHDTFTELTIVPEKPDPTGALAERYNSNICNLYNTENPFITFKDIHGEVIQSFKCQDFLNAVGATRATMFFISEME